MSFLYDESMALCFAGRDSVLKLFNLFNNEERDEFMNDDQTAVKEVDGEGADFSESDCGDGGNTLIKIEEGLSAEVIPGTGVTAIRRKIRSIHFWQRFRKKPKRFLLYGAVTLAFILAVSTAVLLYVNDDTESVVCYENVDVTTTTIDRTLTAAGEITYSDTETVSFSTGKTFKAICVETDDAVVEGQKLAAYSNGTYLTADCNGVIAEINAPETGSTATSSNYITIYPTDAVILDITVPQDEIGIVAKGDEADIIVNADTDTTYKGTITYLGGAASGALSSDSSAESEESSAEGGESGASAAGSTTSSSGDTSGTSYFQVIISVANDGNLKLGMSASCTIMLESKEDVIAVPVEGVYFNGDTRYVYVVGDDGSVTKQTVETGISDADYVEITAGLDGDETVRVERIG